MNQTSPFDHRPDPELGAVLRDALTAEDDARFARRVVAAAEGVWATGSPGGMWWEELVQWTRPGLAAAALAVLVGGALWFATLRMGGTGSDSLGDPLRSADAQLAIPALLAASEAPHMDEVLAVALGN